MSIVTLYIFPLLIGIIITMGMALLAWSRRPDSGFDLVQLLLLALTWWLVGYVLELAHPELSVKFTWSQVQVIAIAFYPILWLLLTLRFLGLEHHLTWGSRLALMILPILTTFVAWTNDWHHWYWEELFMLDTIGPLPILEADYGFYYQWIYEPYAFAAGIFTSALLIYKALKTSKNNRMQAYVLLISTVLPWAGHFLTISPFNPLPGLYWAPVGVVFGMALFLWHLLNFGFINILPDAYRKVIHSLSDVVIVLDPAMRIVDVNQPAEKLFQKNAIALSGQLPTELELLRLILRGYNRQDKLAKTNISLRNCYYDLHVTPLQDPTGKVQGHIITLHDITQLKDAELSEINQREIAEALKDAAAVVNSSLKQDEILAHIHEIVQRVVPHKRSNIMTVTDGIANIKYSHAVIPEYQFKKLPEFTLTVKDIWHLNEMERTGKPIVVPDVNQDEHWVVYENGAWMRSYVGAPIIVDDKLFGFINLDSDTAGQYTQVDANNLKLFSDQVAIAIRNANQHQRIAEQAAGFKTLHEIALKITHELDLQATFDAITESTLKLPGIVATGIYLYQPDEDVLKLVSVVGEERKKPPPGTKIKPGEGLTGTVWTTGQPMTLDSYKTWEGRSAQYDERNLDDAPIGAVPIIWTGKTIGVLPVTGASPEHVKQNMGLLTLLAGQAAIAIENARLYEKVEQQKDRLAGLSNWTQSVSESLDAGVIMDQIVELAVGYMNCVSGGLYLYDDKRNELVWKFPYKIEDDPRFKNTRLKRNEGLAGQAWAENRPLYKNKYDDWPGRVTNLANVGAENLIVAPITVGGDFFGVLCVFGNHTRIFTDFDLYLMELLSTQAGIAIQNADMYTDMLSYAQELNRHNAYLDTFSKAVAHDLLGPLSLCQSHVKLLRDMPAFANDAEAQSMLNHMVESVVGMERIVDDLLLLAQVQMGEKSYELVKMSPVVQVAVEEYTQRIAERGITLELQPDLPPALGYAPWLERVFSNLLGNAVKYIGKENADPRICIRSTHTGNMLRYEVIDNGLGIARADQEHVFEVFTRFNSEHVKGYGIGLAIVHNIITRLGGELGIESEAGKGSTFWFTLHQYKRPPLVNDE